MNILAFDTTATRLSVGYMKNGILEGFESAEGLRHAEILISTIEAALGKAGARLEDMDLFACSRGPGSFMGLRIGLATAKGLSLAAAKPWVSVSYLDAAAAAYCGEDLAIPLIDARKNRVYAAFYRRGARIGEYLDIAVSRLMEALAQEDRVTFLGPDADLVRDFCAERAGFSILQENPEAVMEAMCRLAESTLEQEGPGSPGSGPMYLREPDIG
jgi:tRNA threonylcarbamoyladenosine biosynthesis protein TsaB